MDNYRFCKVCKLSKTDKDFIGRQEDCYKCVYAFKIQGMNSLVEIKKCRICETPLPPERWTYCSLVCAKEGKRRNKYWTHTLKTDSKDWKKRFIF